MERSQLTIAFDEIIKNYKNEASKYSECCPEDLLYAFEHLYNAQIHALESIKQLLTCDKLN